MAPAAPQSNETRRQIWAEKMLALICVHLGWNFSRVDRQTWRIRLVATHYDIPIHEMDLVQKANEYYRAYKEVSRSDPEKKLPLI
jgi:hypothetical protein